MEDKNSAVGGVPVSATRNQEVLKGMSEHSIRHGENIERPTSNELISKYKKTVVAGISLVGVHNFSVSSYSKILTR